MSPNTVDIQRLITEKGYQPCPNCPAVLRPATTVCPHCNTPLIRPTIPAARKGVRSPRIPAPKESAIGGFAQLPAQVVKLIVYGIPVSQGSVSVPAPGVVAYKPELRPWRDKVNNAAAEACGTHWEPANCPLLMSAVFTLPRPQSLPPNMRVHAAVKPDIDKVIRAIQDALSPKDKTKFRVYTEDSRIIGYDEGPYKTYPAPLGTHPWALDEPGVTIAIRPAPPAEASSQESA